MVSKDDSLRPDAVLGRSERRSSAFIEADEIDSAIRESRVKRCSMATFSSEPSEIPTENR